MNLVYVNQSSKFDFLFNHQSSSHFKASNGPITSTFRSSATHPWWDVFYRQPNDQEGVLHRTPPREERRRAGSSGTRSDFLTNRNLNRHPVEIRRGSRSTEIWRIGVRVSDWQRVAILSGAWSRTGECWTGLSFWMEVWTWQMIWQDEAKVWKFATGVSYPVFEWPKIITFFVCGYILGTY